MVMSCSAYGCKNRWSKEKKFRFHRFPFNNPELLQKWVVAVKRESWKPSKASVLCHEHFDNDAYKSDGKFFLKDDAVPTIFTFPVHLQKKEKKRRLIKKHVLPAKQICRKAPTEVSEPMLSRDESSNNVSGFGIVSTPATFPHVPGPSVLKFPITAGPFSETGQNNSVNVFSHPVKNTSSNNTDVLLLKKKIHNLQKKLKRREKKIDSLESLLNIAKKAGDLSDNTRDMLQSTFGQLPFELLINQAKNNMRNPSGRRYFSVMKEFAMTLFFHSSRAYKFLRKKIHLPSESMVRSWVSTVDCYPGFLQEAFAFLKETFNSFKFKDCALIIDSMSIRKQSIWDKTRNKYTGYVECAGLVDEDMNTLASEALVFMIVSLTERFKCPVAYFLIDKINSNVLAELINISIYKLTEINLRVWSITADGLSANVSAFEKLGCKFSGVGSAEMQTYFLHPVNNLPIYVIFDACHMVKLARNALCFKSLISDLGEVSWGYLENLNQLQKDLGFKFANRLSGVHINFKNKIMNVSIAAQTLSSGTADAIDFLLECNHPEFVGAKATVEFIRIIDRIFYLCNSRNPYSTGFKTPLKLCNKDWWIHIFNESITYLESLKLDNVPVIKTPRKMFALGFIVTMKSITALAFELLSRELNPLNFILTYKVSQDHIEFFFQVLELAEVTTTTQMLVSSDEL